MINPHSAAFDSQKHTLSWGETTAARLWDGLLCNLPIDWCGKTVLDFGCWWGYLGKFLLERQAVSACYGVDIHPHWTMMEDGSTPASMENLHLYAGDILEIHELQHLSFDLIFSSGTLMVIPPTTLHKVVTWFYEHLNPGGHCILNTRVFLSQYGGDLQSVLSSPIPHLLFPKRTIDQHLADVGQPPSRYMNPSCAATFLMLYRRAGFEIVQAERRLNSLDESIYHRFADKLSIYDPQELRTSGLVTLLRKPEERLDIDIFEG